jgi:hypothetical protein
VHLQCGKKHESTRRKRGKAEERWFAKSVIGHLLLGGFSLISVTSVADFSTFELQITACELFRAALELQIAAFDLQIAAPELQITARDLLRAAFDLQIAPFDL